MDNFVSIRIPRRWLKAAAVLSVVVAVLAPVAVVASHQFTDVADSHIFHSDIAWLSDNGITRGCNPPTNDMFCPDDGVTRGQMAAFMRRFAQLLGAEDGQVALADHADHASAADSAANAETVGGLQPGDLVRINGAMSDVPINDFTASTWTDIVTTQIEAPIDGVLLVMGSVGVEDDSTLTGDGYIALRLTIDGVAIHDSIDGYTIELSGTPADEPFAAVGSLNAAVAVSKGQHTVAFQAREIGAGTYIIARSVSAVFSAFGGGIPAIPVDIEAPTGYDN